MALLRRPKRKPTPAADPLPIDVRVSPAPYGATVAVAGELDIATAPRARESMAAPALAEAGAVLVDLTGVTFMDSSGLAVLMTFERELSARGGRLAVACPEGAARLLLDVTGVAEALELHLTREAAEAALSAPPGSP